MGRNQRQTLSFLVCRDSLYLCVSKDLLYSFVCVSKSNNRQGPWISFFFDSREIVFSVLYVRVCSGILLYNLMWANRSQFFSFLFSNVNWNVAENSQLLSFSTLFYDWLLTLNFLDQYGRQLCQCRWLPLSSLNLFWRAAIFIYSNDCMQRLQGYWSMLLSALLRILHPLSTVGQVFIGQGLFVVFSRNRINV